MVCGQPVIRRAQPASERAHAQAAAVMSAPIMAMVKRILRMTMAKWLPCFASLRRLVPEWSPSDDVNREPPPERFRPPECRSVHHIIDCRRTSRSSHHHRGGNTPPSPNPNPGRCCWPVLARWISSRDGGNSKPLSRHPQSPRADGAVLRGGLALRSTIPPSE